MYNSYFRRLTFSERLRSMTIEFWLFYLLSICLVIVISSIFFKGKTSGLPCITRIHDETNSIKKNGIDELTFITYVLNNEIPSPRLASIFENWLSVVPTAELLIIRDHKYFDNSNKFLKKNFRTSARYIACARTETKYGVYIDEYLGTGLRSSKSMYNVFIKPNVILSSEWYLMLKSILQTINNSVIVVAPSVISENGFLVNSFRDIPTNFTSETDFWLFNKNMQLLLEEKVPPFMIERGYWSNWLTAYLDTKFEVVSMGEGNFVTRLRNEVFPEDKKQMYNNLTSIINNNLSLNSVNDVKWVVSNKNLIKNKNGSFHTLKTL